MYEEIMKSIKEILELDNLTKKHVKRYPKKRELYNILIKEKGKHFSAIVGPRGVGKTILLKQLRAKIKDSIYISLDALEENIDLFKIIKDFSEIYKIKNFFIDEIHFLKDYEKQLKKIFDFLEVRLTFSSSVSISLYDSSHDLSRRVKLLKLLPFSFREYLFFKENVKLAPLTVENIIKKEWSPEHMRYAYLFEGYLKGGLYPFSLEEPEVLSLLKNIVKKITARDIPHYVKQINFDEINKIEKVLEFVGKSDVDGINYSSISRNAGITKYKAKSYVDLLKRAFILNPLLPKGRNVLKEPKVLMYLPFRLLYREYQYSIGGIREDFFAEMMEKKNIEVKYLKTKRGAKTPDFYLKDNQKAFIIEVGGKGKGYRQFKDVDKEKKLILSHSEKVEGKNRPLFLIGYV